MMRTLSTMLWGAVVLLLMGSWVVVVRFPEIHWVHYPLHSFVESLGAFIALLVTALILLLNIYRRMPLQMVWIISALIGMGILDGFHAISRESQTFIWLHSLAMLNGGVIFALVWLPDSFVRVANSIRLPLIVLIFSLLGGAASFLFLPMLPQMSIDDQFTPFATALNALSGVLFLGASGYFVLQRQLQRLASRDSLIFACHTLLFGLSGILFAFSTLWDSVWWYWHLLRFVAYILVLYYFFMLSRAEERQLHTLNSELEAQVSRRTLQLRNELKERERVEKKLKHLATHDPLTGLYNRNELERRIADDIARSSRYNHPLSLFMVDIDHFKEINDRYGHMGGDRVLCSLASELGQSLRKTDYVARYGGEEFLVVLPETPHRMAIELGERLLRRISGHQIELGETKIRLTISIGVASFPEAATRWTDLLDAADMAMYQAKHDGRNCLRSAQQPVN